MKRTLVGGTALLVASMMACTATLAPIYEPESPAGIQPNSDPYTADEVRRAIIAGMSSRGWTAVRPEARAVTGYISVQAHHATVDVQYSAQGWKIVHVSSSEGLRHGDHWRHGEIIHRRYNHWVRLLDDEIRDALPAAAAPQAPQGRELPSELPVEPHPNPQAVNPDHPGT